jgi:hypothetical protein
VGYFDAQFGVSVFPSALALIRIGPTCFSSFLEFIGTTSTVIEHVEMIN